MFLVFHMFYFSLKIRLAGYFSSFAVVAPFAEKRCNIVRFFGWTVQPIICLKSFLVAPLHRCCTVEKWTVQPCLMPNSWQNSPLVAPLHPLTLLSTEMKGKGRECDATVVHEAEKSVKRRWWTMQRCNGAT